MAGLGFAGDSDVTLSFSSRDLVQERVTYPAAEMLELFRLVYGSNATQDDFVEAVGPPTSFIGDEHGPSLSADESRVLLALEDRANPVVLEPFPYFEQSETLVSRDDQLGVFDGLVPEAGEDLSPFAPDRRLSASQLETYGSCPRRYFFRYGLGLKSPDIWEPMEDRWLTPLQFGTLMHSVFEAFLKQLTGTGEVPDPAKHQTQLLDLLAVSLEEVEHRVPILNSEAYDADVEHLQDICDIFLLKEHEYCLKHGARPWVMEASMGLDEEEGPLDCRGPVPVNLEGGTIQMVGRLDRVDRFYIEGSEHYAIWDYKSGSDVSFRSDDVFQQGRKLQPILYMGMLRHRLDQIGEDADAVESFGYFFPSPKTEGNRIEWRNRKLEPGLDVVNRLTQLMKSGVFVPTTNSDDCRFCEFQSICGDPRDVANRSWRKSSSVNDEILAPWRELREIRMREPQ